MITGDLELRFLAGFDPPVGTRLELGRYDTQGGEFESVVSSGLTSGKAVRAFVEDRILKLEIVSL